MSDSLQTIQVEAYAGASYPEYPRALWLEQSRLTVKEVLRSWRQPGTKHFLVELDDGRFLQVYYDFEKKCWQHPPQTKHQIHVNTDTPTS